MPRARRIDALGMVHHVFTHAVDGFDFFVDTEDRRDLLARLGSVLPEEGARCFAWALLSNHRHLVVKTGERRLGTLMQRVLTGYAMRVNRLGGRRGYLVWSRYGSRPVCDDADLSVVEIARVLDLSHAAVSQTLSRATTSDGKGPSPS